MSDPNEFVQHPRKIQLGRMEYRYKFRDEPDRHGPDSILFVRAVEEDSPNNRWFVYINETLAEHYGLPSLMRSGVNETDAKQWVIGLGRLLETAWKNADQHAGV